MKTLLLVEDDDEVRYILKKLLENEHPHCTITDVADAEQAITLLRAGDLYDAVLTDLDMPNGEGLSLIAIARARLPHAKIALMSSRMTEEVKQLAKVAGADASFHKPLSQLQRKTFCAVQ